MKKKRKITGSQSIENLKDKRRKSLIFFPHKHHILHSSVSRKNFNTKLNSSRSLIKQINVKNKNKK